MGEIIKFDLLGAYYFVRRTNKTEYGHYLCN